jgi:hypothetical protein
MGLVVFVALLLSQKTFENLVSKFSLLNFVIKSTFKMENQRIQEDLESIRNLMERSVKFISLSGLSGILAGVYAMAGATIVYFLLYYPLSPFGYRIETIQDSTVLMKLILIATTVLVASLATGYWLSSAKAKKNGQAIWNVTSQRLLVNLAIPLATGGIFVLILLFNGHYGIAAPACLIFYGLALINASPNLVEEVRYLGYSEIIIGLISSLLPGYGLLFWTIGFGLLHILYGSMMYNKYDR